MYCGNVCSSGAGVKQRLGFFLHGVWSWYMHIHVHV